MPKRTWHWAQQPRPESHLYHFLAVWLWACYLALLCLSVLLCKAEVIIRAPTPTWWLNEVIYAKCLEHWLCRGAVCMGWFCVYHPVFTNLKTEAQKNKSFTQDHNAPFGQSADIYPSYRTALNRSAIKHSSPLTKPGRSISVCLIDDEEEINSS